MPQTIVIDARAHMLGRLASVVAKQILSGYQIVSGPRGLCRRAAGVLGLQHNWIWRVPSLQALQAAGDGTRAAAAAVSACSSATAVDQLQQLGCLPGVATGKTGTETQWVDVWGPC